MFSTSIHRTGGKKITEIQSNRIKAINSYAIQTNRRGDSNNSSSSKYSKCQRSMASQTCNLAISYMILHIGNGWCAQFFFMSYLENAIIPIQPKCSALHQARKSCIFVSASSVYFVRYYSLAYMSVE